jgi:integrase
VRSLRRPAPGALASPWTRPGDPVFAATSGKPKAYRNVRRALEKVADELGLDLVSHDFRRSLASFLIVAARADEAAVTAVMGHANIETTRRIDAGDWRDGGGAERARAAAPARGGGDRPVTSGGASRRS